MAVADTAAADGLWAGGSKAASIGITRAQISQYRITTPSIKLSGFYEPGDLGYGAEYIPGTSSGPMAIQDAANKWWNLVVADGVQAGWCGVKCDGVTDDTAAFRKAWDIACSAKNPTLYLEAGVMLISSAATLFTVVNNMSVIGANDGAYAIKWVEGSLTILFGRRWDAPGRAHNVAFKDFAVIGTHGDGGVYSPADRYPFLTYAVDSLLHEGVRVEKTRVMAIAARGCTNVRAHYCTVRYCARDGINFADCDDYKITHCLGEYVDDDVFAAHNDTNDRIDRRGVISDNTARFCQGIKALGAVSLAVSNNILEFCMGQGIAVSTVNYGTEGRNAAIGISITGNQIKNCIDRGVVDNLNSMAPYIFISGESAQAGGLLAIPGENVTSTGAVIDPWPYALGNDGGVSTDPVPGAYAIEVSGNVFVRDCPAGGKLSDLGYGTFYTRNGPVDPTLTDASLRQPGVFLAGKVRGAAVLANSFTGLGYAFFVADNADLKMDIKLNTTYDVTGAIVFSGSNTKHHRIISQANTWDIDSLLKSSGRGANGTWTSAGAGPTAILMQNAYGVVSRGDTFRNCCRVSDAALGAAQGTSTKLFVMDALLECQPAAGGFSTSNKGIGECPNAGPAFRYSIVDSDPASSTYGNRLNHCVLQASAMPSTGTYLIGMFVHNTGPSISGDKVLLGWLRLTTGSGHTLNTDWAACYASTS